jgi:hypothetical protein
MSPERWSVPAFEVFRTEGRESLPVHRRVRTRLFSVLVSGFELSHGVDQDLNFVASLYQFAILANMKHLLPET